MTSLLYASPQGTEAYQARFGQTLAPGHFHLSQGLWLSSIGLGTYLGEADSQTDTLYGEAIAEALRCGCNVIDSAINYRHQRSERVIGQAVAALMEGGVIKREEVAVATKGGYLAFDGDVPPDPRTYIDTTYIEPGFATQDEIVEWNCFAPRYIDDQVERSRRNLGLDCIDIYYLHNPEVQLQKWSRQEFYRRIGNAFRVLEEKVKQGKISMYGTATWNGYRQDPAARDYLSLADLMDVAEQVGGKDHHFKVVQLPYNLAMPEALTRRNQRVSKQMVSFLEAAHYFGITVMTSAAILQGQLSRRLPAFVGEALLGLTTDAQRSIQFVRSTPGVTTALVGMKQKAHVRENLETAKASPASLEQFQKLFEQES
jgi:aryl-alcohol dehydrogenase-like predicted oxidoreductase